MKDSINKTFNHFKIHTQYSICEGAIKIEQLKDYCKTNKIQSLGISDTHILSGALEFSEKYLNPLPKGAVAPGARAQNVLPGPIYSTCS